MNLTSPETIKRIMSSKGLKFNKSLGQNFLTDDTVVERTIKASGIDKNYGVIEVGPGIGTLTEKLAEAAGKVIAIELDRNIADYLKSAFAAYNNVEIIQGDALKTDLKNLIEEKLAGLKVSIVANLPYYITTPLIMKFLEEGLPLESITVMIQKEVAQRMTAAPGSKDYGALSVAVQYHSTPDIIMNVPPESFMPPPKVTSSVIRLLVSDHIKPQVGNEKLLFEVVKFAFGQRRKTLVNALASGFGRPKEEVRSIVSSVIGNENVRGETLSLSQFIQISEKFV